jgi:undecaprenyl-diphosphatase
VRRELHRKAYAWASAAAVLFVGISWLIFKERAESFDSAIIGAVQGRETAALTSLAKAFSWIGSTVGVVAISIVIMLFLGLRLGHRKQLAMFVASVGGAALLNGILKSGFQRERPSLMRLIEETGYSFPSGHSMAAFALYGALAYLLWRHVGNRGGRIVLIGLCSLVILCIGLSRIYLGVHYPSDIIGGYLASGVWLGLCIEALHFWTADRTSKARHG